MVECSTATWRPGLDPGLYFVLFKGSTFFHSILLIFIAERMRGCHKDLEVGEILECQRIKMSGNRQEKPRLALKVQGKLWDVKKIRVAVISAKNHKRQRRKRQSVTAKQEKSRTPKVLTAILTLPNLT